MMEHDISELIYKSISKTISETEEEVLKDWLSIPENEKLYHRIIDGGEINKKFSVYKQVDTEKAYKRIAPHLDSSSGLHYLQVFKYAAIFIGLFFTAFYFFQREVGDTTAPILKVADEQIILTTDDGLTKAIDEKASTELTDENGNVLGVQNGNRLTYNNSTDKATLVFNTLTVPYGKRFELVLADGTLVHLNAGTSLRYPVKFLEGSERQVFLDGEAYFDVAEDKEHPFIVNADALDVQVYGTQFNVTAYPENEFVDVVLVEGSVGLYNDGKVDAKTMLSPGFKGGFNKNDLNIDVKKVNTSFHTSWIYGELVFRSMPFDQIVKRLERYYNVEIVNKNKVLGQEMFNASFSSQPIENILIYFNETHEIDYKIENNQVIIQ